MFNLQIDQTTEAFFPKDETCFGQVMESLSHRMVEAGRVITEIKMNGQALTGGKQDDFYRFPIEEIKAVELSTADPQSLASDALDSTEEHIRMLHRSALRTAELFRLGDQLEANENYSKLIESMRWLLKGVDALTGMMNIDQNQALHNGKPLRHYQDSLLIPIFDSMYEAQKTEDWIALADIMEYELVPALDEWSNVIPTLRNLVIGVE
jgi:hypothetical protein